MDNLHKYNNNKYKSKYLQAGGDKIYLRMGIFKI